MNIKTGDTRNNQKISQAVRFSFTFAYIILLTTASVTFIEAISTDDPIVRHVMNLETVISIIAGYFYSVFMGKLDDADKKNNPLDYKEITDLRYQDWSLTTPMMLLTLCLVLSKNSKQDIRLATILTIIALNYVMLGFGYAGEAGILPRIVADIAGFIPFFIMFYIIFQSYVAPKPKRENYFLYGWYLFFWSMYGIAYYFPDNQKNIFMNGLDCITKAMLGLALWLYYIRVVKL